MRPAFECPAPAKGLVIGREPHGSIIGLLLGHAIQPDRAAFEICHACIPHQPSVTAPAKIRMGDIKTDKTECRTITNRGNARSHHAIDEQADKALRIGGLKRRRIGKPGIPSLGLRPVDQCLDLLEIERTDHDLTHKPVSRPGSKTSSMPR
ncbi:hypothetical protein D3C87_1531270 [compost metagenome]